MSLPIDPTRPVGGNFTGTFAGFIAMATTGFLAKKGLLSACASFICVPGDPAAFLTCPDAEFYLAVMTIAGVGSLVNYVVTRNEQLKKLKELWESLPSVYREYPGDKEKSDKVKSTGMENGNFNKP